MEKKENGFQLSNDVCYWRELVWIWGILQMRRDVLRVTQEKAEQVNFGTVLVV